MKKYISKIALCFCVIFIFCGTINYIDWLSDRANRDAIQAFIQTVAIIGGGVVFLCLYRIIDLLELKQTK